MVLHWFNFFGYWLSFTHRKYKLIEEIKKSKFRVFFWNKLPTKIFIPRFFFLIFVLSAIHPKASCVSLSLLIYLSFLFSNHLLSEWFKSSNKENGRERERKGEGVVQRSGSCHFSSKWLHDRLPILCSQSNLKKYIYFNS